MSEKCKWKIKRNKLTHIGASNIDIKQSTNI